MRIVRLAPWYLFAQGLAVLFWWIALLTSSSFRDLFEMGSPEVLGNFFFADVILAFTSMTAGVSMSEPSLWTSSLIALTLGSFVYATAMTFTWVGYSDAGYLGIFMMSLASLATLCCLLIHHRTRP